MTPESTPRQRRLVIGILIATVLTFTLVTLDLARGGRPDPPALRAAATLLDGAWRFHTGDDPGWASPKLDDSAWGTIDLTAPPGSHDGDVGLPDYVGGWMSHGHPDYHGYAWYRRTLDIPPGPGSWDILGPTLVENGYELYWNGRLLGGSGRLGPDPRLVGTRPTQFALPADAAGTRGVLAIRAYLPPGAGAAEDGGGLHSAPILAPPPISDGLHRAQWERTIAGYVVDAIEPLAMFATVGLALWGWPRSGQKGFLLFAAFALAFMAARRLNNATVAWTDLQDLSTYAWLASWMWVPAVAAWTLAWNRWCGRPWRSVDAAAIVLASIAMAGALSHAARVMQGCRIASILLLVVIGIRIAREGPMRLLATVTLASIMVAMFGGELLDPLGVPGIWFPFGIGVSRTQYLYVLVIPLVAMVIARTIPSRDTVPR